MRPKSSKPKASAERVVKDIRRATRRHFSAEDKIRIVLEGPRGDDSIAELCRKEGINQNLYFRWSKEFLEAGKKRVPCFHLIRFYQFLRVQLNHPGIRPKARKPITLCLERHGCPNQSNYALSPSI